MMDVCRSKIISNYNRVDTLWVNEDFKHLCLRYEKKRLETSVAVKRSVLLDDTPTTTTTTTKIGSDRNDKLVVGRKKKQSKAPTEKRLRGSSSPSRLRSSPQPSSKKKKSDRVHGRKKKFQQKRREEEQEEEERPDSVAARRKKLIEGLKIFETYGIQTNETVIHLLDAFSHERYDDCITADRVRNGIDALQSEMRVALI